MGEARPSHTENLLRFRQIVGPTLWCCRNHGQQPAVRARFCFARTSQDVAGVERWQESIRHPRSAYASGTLTIMSSCAVSMDAFGTDAWGTTIVAIRCAAWQESLDS